MGEHDLNESAFRVIYERHFDAVARYCLRRLPERIAPDAVSEVFLTAWRRFDSMPPDDESLLWLYGVARNVVRNMDRSQRRALRLSARVKVQPCSPEPSPETQIVRNEEATLLLQALDTLKPDDREVLRLRAYEGLSMKQISIAVGCSEEAAKKRVSRALRRLRRVVPFDEPLPSGVKSRAIQEGGER